CTGGRRAAESATRAVAPCRPGQRTPTTQHLPSPPLQGVAPAPRAGPSTCPAGLPVRPAGRAAPPPRPHADPGSPPPATRPGAMKNSRSPLARAVAPALLPWPPAQPISPCDEGPDHVIDVEELSDTKVAVLGLTTTTGTPPLIVEAVVYYVTGGRITAGPFS